MHSVRGTLCKYVAKEAKIALEVFDYVAEGAGGVEQDRAAGFLSIGPKITFEYDCLLFLLSFNLHSLFVTGLLISCNLLSLADRS